MKLLRAFWKLFKKNKIKNADPQKESGLDNRVKADSLIKNRDLVDKTQQIFTKKTEKVHIQVGLDFGTSSTKVVFSQLGRRFFRALNFNHKLPNFPSYCIPSMGAIGDNDRLLLGVSAAKALLEKKWDNGLQRFKVVVAGKHDSSFKDFLTEQKYNGHFAAHDKKPIEPEMLAAVFLAHMMRKSKKIIKSLPEYRSVDLDFAFNICMPIDHLENNAVKSVFERIFAWAELIELEWWKGEKNFNPLKAARILKNSRISKGNKVFAVPEAVASFASYLVSLRKKEGLHAIIDFGSGTTDVSICNLFLQLENTKCYWYAARNFPRGTINIERMIASHMLNKLDRNLCTSIDVCDCLEKLSLAKEKNLNLQENGGLSQAVYKELSSFRASNEYKKIWGDAYRHLKIDTPWKDVEIFTCGGGSNLPHIKKIFSEPWWRNLHTNYRVSKLPTPDNYDPGESKAPFERMSVAYGLAIPLPQLDQFNLPDSSPIHTPPPPPMIDIDIDDLYPKD